MTDAAQALRRGLTQRAGARSLADVGEKRLIGEYLLPLAHAASGDRGLGDDAAILAFPAGHELLVSSDRVPTDLLARRFGLMSAEAFGRYVVRVNVSDLAAVAGDPLGLFVTAAFPSETPVRHVLDMMWGLYDEGAQLGCPVVGGDTKSAAEESVSATVLGSAPRGRALRRGPIAVGDEVLVSGPLGTAGAALRWFGAGLDGSDALDPAMRGRLVDAIVAPVPRLDLVEPIRRSRGLKAGMDITDGLGQSLVELAGTSGVGMLVEEGAIPLSEPARVVAAALGLDPAELVGGIGNDLELLLVAAPGAALPFASTRIGVVTTEGGVRLTDEATTRPFPVSGFEHFRKSAGAYVTAPPADAR